MLQMFARRLQIFPVNIKMYEDEEQNYFLREHRHEVEKFENRLLHKASTRVCAERKKKKREREK